MPYELLPWQMDAHLAAIEYMANLDKNKPRPERKKRKKSIKNCSKTRKVLRSWRVPIVRAMKQRMEYE